MTLVFSPFLTMFFSIVAVLGCGLSRTALGCPCRGGYVSYSFSWRKYIFIKIYLVILLLTWIT